MRGLTPKELDAATASETDDDEPHPFSSALLWSTRRGWGEDSYLSSKGRRLAGLVVEVVSTLETSVHPDNDYPSITRLADDQLVISAHPLDRLAAYGSLVRVLSEAGYAAVPLVPVPTVGSPL